MTWRVVFEPDAGSRSAATSTAQGGRGVCERMRVHDEGAVVVEIGRSGNPRIVSGRHGQECPAEATTAI